MEAPGRRRLGLILLDAYAVVALALDERAAAEVEPIVRSHPTAVTATNYLETTERLMRLGGWSPDETARRMAVLLDGGADVRRVDADVAWRGALLRARHYDRQTCGLSLADCVLLASADPGDAIATADPAVAAVARAEGIGLVPLPDSSGQRP